MEIVTAIVLASAMVDVIAQASELATSIVIALAIAAATAVVLGVHSVIVIAVVKSSWNTNSTRTSNRNTVVMLTTPAGTP